MRQELNFNLCHQTKTHQNGQVKSSKSPPESSVEGKGNSSKHHGQKGHRAGAATLEGLYPPKGKNAQLDKAWSRFQNMSTWHGNTGARCLPSSANNPRHRYY
ncbi:hypothetical protein PAHAL_3G193100 [Panicum hallii]|uniref:Uncharacterized protein n=1 Tax=Panicum hallii TaxID=206008 RepID=A0A2T8KIQ7_9POAL|nr:hypothetical protein PAHAL_3G193100 [Panicum hallii]